LVATCQVIKVFGREIRLFEYFPHFFDTHGGPCIARQINLFLARRRKRAFLSGTLAGDTSGARLGGRSRARPVGQAAVVILCLRIRMRSESAADEESRMRSRITKAFTFSAAHWLPHVPAGHKCGQLHGHSYRVILGLEGELDPQLGWVVDFGEVLAKVQPLRERLDHSCLNEIEGLENSTAEILAAWIFHQLESVLPLLTDVTVEETPSSSAHYRPSASS
jgi:6-pyruvoyltetrahydropterin/6-carboxytetrahydropterin synthase